MNNQTQSDIGANVAPRIESTFTTQEEKMYADPNPPTEPIVRLSFVADSNWDDSWGDDDQEEISAIPPQAPYSRREVIDSDQEDSGNFTPQRRKRRRKTTTTRKSTNFKREERLHSDCRPAVMDCGDDGKAPEEDEKMTSARETARRSPACVFLGHPNAGKTSLQDAIRGSRVQRGEANGITQENGATNISIETVKGRTRMLQDQFPNQKLELPGILLIDTPGHECFSTMRCRGASMCDIAVLVVNIVEDLKPLAVECLNLLRQSDKRFIIVLNQIDRLNGWVSGDEDDVPFRRSLKSQSRVTRQHFRHRVEQLQTQFSNLGFNTSLYYKNKKLRDVSLVPLSAMTNEGLPDLLMVIIAMAQQLLEHELELSLDAQDFGCSILDVKQMDGFGTTIDVILSNGVLRKTDTIVVCGTSGPIVSCIRSLQLPEEGQDIRVCRRYEQVDEVFASAVLRIAGDDLKSAVVGSSILVVPRDVLDQQRREVVEMLKEEVQSQLDRLWGKMRSTSAGVCVQASTLASLEVLVGCLGEMDAPICNMNVSNVVSEKDVRKANVMRERGFPEYSAIVALNSRVSRDVSRQAREMNVRMFGGDLVHDLLNEFEAYIDAVKLEKEKAARRIAVFPCQLEIVHVIRRKPIIVGCLVKRGSVRINTPLVAQKSKNVNDCIPLGRIVNIRDSSGRDVEVANVGDKISIEMFDPAGRPVPRYGKQFDDSHPLISLVTRESINVMKEHFREHLMSHRDDVLLLKELKVFFCL